MGMQSTTDQWKARDVVRIKGGIRLVAGVDMRLRVHPTSTEGSGHEVLVHPTSTEGWT